MTILFIFLLIIGLVFLLIFGVYTAIKKKDDSLNTAQFQPLDWFLAVYSAKSENATIDTNSPKLLIKDYDSNVNFLLADNAPILTEYTEVQMLKELKKQLTSRSNPSEIAILHTITSWVNTQIELGFTHFLFQLEK